MKNIRSKREESSNESSRFTLNPLEFDSSHFNVIESDDFTSSDKSRAVRAGVRANKRKFPIDYKIDKQIVKKFSAIECAAR